MKHRFLIDEDCPLNLETLLNSKGYEAIHVRTCGLSGTKDPELFIFAQQEQRILTLPRLKSVGFLIHRDHLT